MSYRLEYAPGRWGLFPVRRDDGIWQTCDLSGVTVRPRPRETAEAERVSTEDA